MTDFRRDQINDSEGAARGSVRTPRGTRVTPADTPSDTHRAETRFRETLQQELLELGAWLADNPKAARKNLKPVRDTVVLDPGVYYNRGTGVVERIFYPQHAALGQQLFRVSTDPAASIEAIRRKVLEGK